MHMKKLFIFLFTIISVSIYGQDNCERIIIDESSKQGADTSRHYIDGKEIHPTFLSVLDPRFIKLTPNNDDSNKFHFIRKEGISFNLVTFNDFKECIGLKDKNVIFIINGTIISSFSDPVKMIVNPDETDKYIIENIIYKIEIQKIKTHEDQIYLVVLQIMSKDKQGTAVAPELNPQISYTAKPAIYLYPTEETKISIKHDFAGKIGTTYPDYNNGWLVEATPEGKIRNLKDGRTYNYLFWDGFYLFPESHYNYTNGFYVKKDEYNSFLLEKLTTIGLNETEVNDFIVYWLPQLNKYNKVFIHFRINDDIGGSSKLTVNPQPDNIIRVFMEFNDYNGEEKLPPQELKKQDRKGFTLLEWGGAEIKSKNIQ